jgi:L-amino acid N-acyltransferase YncA
LPASPPDPLIRPARPDDAPGCLEIYAPIVIDTHTSFETQAPSAGEFASRIKNILKNYPWLVAEIDGRIAGYVYARRHRERAAYRFSVEVSVFIADGFRRRGVGRMLYLELFDVLRRQGYFNAFAGIALPNDASVALHESLGFKPVGVYPKTGYKFNRWHDVGWWSLRLRDESDRVQAPIPFSSLDY